MAWNRETAVSYARTHAGASSLSRCAEYTRRAIEAGGVDIGNTRHAKDYGGNLERAEFREVPPGSTLIAGDVAVIQPHPGGNQSGHMTIFDGTTWFSDFRQRSMYPGPGYRAAQPSYKIYRKD